MHTMNLNAVLLGILACLSVHVAQASETCRNFHVTDLASDYATLSWLTPEVGHPLVGYIIHCRLAGGQWEKLAGRGFTGHTIDYFPLEPSTNYECRCRVWDEGKSAPVYIRRGFRTHDNDLYVEGVPGNPVGLSAVTATSSSVGFLWWSPVNGGPIEGYIVSYRVGTPRDGTTPRNWGDWTFISDEEMPWIQNKYTVTGLQPEQTVQMRVKSWNHRWGTQAGGDGAWAYGTSLPIFVPTPLPTQSPTPVPTYGAEYEALCGDFENGGGATHRLAGTTTNIIDWSTTAGTTEHPLRLSSTHASYTLQAGLFVPDVANFPTTSLILPGRDYIFSFWYQITGATGDCDDTMLSFFSIQDGSQVSPPEQRTGNNFDGRPSFDGTYVLEGSQNPMSKYNYYGWCSNTGGWKKGIATIGSDQFSNFWGPALWHTTSSLNPSETTASSDGWCLGPAPEETTVGPAVAKGTAKEVTFEKIRFF